MLEFITYKTGVELFVPLLMSFVWHIARAFLLMSTGEKFWDSIFCRHKVSTTAARNIIHSRLGIVHCLGSLIGDGVCLIQTWNEEWYFQRDFETEQAITVPMLCVSFTLSYFISDIYVIYDFPVYLRHHIAGIFNTYWCLFCGAHYIALEGIFTAEIGGLILNVYILKKNVYTHGFFILTYGLTRLTLVPGIVYRMWRSAFWIPCAISSFFTIPICVGAVLLMFENWRFLGIHINKFLARFKHSHSHEQKLHTS